MNNQFGNIQPLPFDNNDDNLYGYTCKGFFQILDNYRQQYPHHAAYIDNLVKNGTVDLNCLTQSIYNSGRIIDGNGRIDMDTMGMFINEKIRNLMSMVDTELQKQPRMNPQINMGGNRNDDISSLFSPRVNNQSSMFKHNVQHATPFDMTSKVKKEEPEIKHDTGYSTISTPDPTPHYQITDKKKLNKLDLMTDDNLFRKGFKLNRIYTNKDQDIASIIESTSKNHTCDLTDIIRQIHICYTNGLTQYLNTNSEYLIKVEFDDIIITGKTDTTLKFFETINEIARTHHTDESTLDNNGFDSFIKDIWSTHEFTITHNAYMFDNFIIKRINKLLSKYLRRQPSHGNDNPYEYFDSFPSISKVGEIINEQNLITFLVEKEYFTDDTLIKKAIKRIKFEFMYNLVCRKDNSIHISGDRDLDHILFNNSLPFNIVNADDKFKTIKEINDARTLIMPPEDVMESYENNEVLTREKMEENFEEDRKEKVNIMYNKIIGESTIIFKDRKKVIFQDLFGGPEYEFLQGEHEMNYFGELKTKNDDFTMSDMFKDVDSLISIETNKDTISYHIYDVYYTVDKRHVFKYVKSETLEKEKFLIQIEMG